MTVKAQTIGLNDSYPEDNQANATLTLYYPDISVMITSPSEGSEENCEMTVQGFVLDPMGEMIGVRAEIAHSNGTAPFFRYQTLL